MNNDLKTIDLAQKDIWICGNEMKKLVNDRKVTFDMANRTEKFIKGKEFLKEIFEFDNPEMLPVLYQIKTGSNNLFNKNYLIIQKHIAHIMLDKGLIDKHDYDCNSFLLEYDFDGEGNSWFNVAEHCPCNMQDRELKEPIMVQKYYKFVGTWLETLCERVVCLDEWSEWKKSNRHW